MPKQLKPVRPSPAMQAAYQAKLDRLIAAMHRSLAYWLRSAYRNNEPAIVALASDALPATALRAAMRALATRWQRVFDRTAPKLARHFATVTIKRSEASLRKTLRDGGISVRFEPGEAARDVLEAVVNENVALIRSIAQTHLTQVEGLVMRSVMAGRDLGSLAQALEQQYGVTRRRAALIARDQNNKSTANILRARQLELGIKEAIWMHSGGGKHPRPSHVRAGRDKERFDLARGWFDPEVRQWVLPGELINCRCVSRPLVPGFS